MTCGKKKILNFPWASGRLLSNPLIKLAKNDLIWPVSHPRTMPIVYQLSTLFLIRWKQMFVSCMDKHAPRKLKRISKKRAPWITRGLLHRMHRRDLMKKKAISNDHVMWEKFKCARNQANNAIKHANKRRCSDNLEASKGNPRKTWNLINELSSRNTSKSSNILEIQVDNRTISTSGDKLLMNTSQILRKY